MSWTKTDHEGRVMWRDSDGTMVDSHEAIEAIEKLRTLPEPLRLKGWHQEQIDKMFEDEEPAHPITVIIILAMIIGCIVMVAIGN